MTAYGCHNRPRPTAGSPLPVQDGYHGSPFATRFPRMVDVPYVMTVPCQYTQQHASDPLCSGCVHRSKETV